MTPSQRNSRLTAAILTLVAVAAPIGPRANAVPSCITWTTGVEKDGTNNTQQGNHVGVKSSVHVYGSSSGTCIRVASIAVMTSGTHPGIVEFGWYVGYDSVPDNLYSGTGACSTSSSGVYHSNPTLFVWWVNDGSTGNHCRNLGTVASGQDLLMHAHDENLNGSWNVGYSPAGNIAAVGVNFSRGQAITNAERHASTESNHEEFRQLQLEVAGLTTWGDFSNSQPFPASDDTQYYWCKYSEQHTEVLSSFNRDPACISTG